MRQLMIESNKLATGTLVVASPFDGRELDQVVAFKMSFPGQDIGLQTR